jgi:choline dehydrogenase
VTPANTTASVLAQHGIETKIDLPTVGESVQDQWVNTLVYATTFNVTGHVPYVIFPTAQDVFGSETAAIGASVKANLSSWAQAASDARNGSVSAAAMVKRFEIQHDLIFNQNVTVSEIYTIGSEGVAGSSYWILMPFSWGSVHSDSGADIAMPVIDANVFSVDFDIQMLIGIGKLVQNVWATSPLSDIVVENVVPGDSSLPANATDAQWRAFATGTGKCTKYLKRFLFVSLRMKYTN